MKDVQTNLENVENIVGRKMVSMEHQLKSELEKSVECMADRMESKSSKRQNFWKRSKSRTPL